MLRALALASVFAFLGGAAMAQPAPGAGMGAPPSPQAPYAAGAPAYQPSPAYGPGAAGHRPVDPETRGLRQAMRAACATDMSTYCADTGQGDRRARHQCMMANRTRFTPACQQAMADLQAHRRQMRMGGNDEAGEGAQPVAPSTYPVPPQ